MLEGLYKNDAFSVFPRNWRRYRVLGVSMRMRAQEVAEIFFDTPGICDLVVEGNYVVRVTFSRDCMHFLRV